MSDAAATSATFRALVETADRKFARVRDAPSYGRVHNTHYLSKVFKTYMRLWKFQQENRSTLVAAGLKRWEIGEIASRIGQLYFGQYMRTSEARFLAEAYVFYEAILSRRYFDEKEKKIEIGVRFKELRFYARFLLVAVILNRTETVQVVAERFKALVDDSSANYKETNFKEWRLVVQEIVRFMKADTAFMNVRPLRYSAILDSYSASLPYVTRFHAKRVLKFQDALLTSYHQNEVKFAELTLDTYRMLQCLEWEPSGAFYHKHPVESKENGSYIEHSGASAASGIIDMNLAADMTDSSLPPNPKKAVIYRPSVTHLIAVMATICEELPVDSVMLLYLSASGTASHSNVNQLYTSGGSHKSSKHINSLPTESTHAAESRNDKAESRGYYDKYLWFGPRRNGGENNLYPADIIPFTRKPLFLIVDSDNSHAFKVVNGAERGETAALLLLSPLRPIFKNPADADSIQNGSQFTFFLTSPVSAFCQLVGLSSDTETDVGNGAESILSDAFSKWEVILLTSTKIDLVWAQVMSDPFLRRLILRFIFCRAVISYFCPPEDSEQYLPVCIPFLPSSVSPDSEVVQSSISKLAKHLRVYDCFNFEDA